MQDEKILDLFFDRDEKAIKETALKYGAALRHISENITGSAEDADECVNDTYLAAWDSIPPERPERLFAWLARTARNYALKRVEARTRQKRNAVMVELSAELSECLPSGSDVVREYEQKRLNRVIDSFVRGLDDESQFVFMRKYFYCDPIGAIEEKTGFSPSKIKSMLARARKKLKKELQKEGFTL